MNIFLFYGVFVYVFVQGEGFMGGVKIHPISGLSSSLPV